MFEAAASTLVEVEEAVWLVAPTTVFVLLTGAGIGGNILLVIGNHAARNASETTIMMRDLRSIEIILARGG